MPMLRTIPSKLPLRLGKPPLIEAIFEIRFQPTREDSTQLLPGLIFGRLGSEYPRSEAMPVASIPSEIRQRDPILRYQYHYRISGDSAAILIGDRSAGVSALPPYQGWDTFKPRIDAFLSVLKESALLDRLERFSLKFTNLLVESTDSQLSLLNLDIRLGGAAPPDQGFQFRTELNDANLIRIIEIKGNVTADFTSGESRNGLLLSIDCIKQVPSGSLDELTLGAIEEIHQDLRQIFFGLITPSTLSALDPKY